MTRPRLPGLLPCAVVLPCWAERTLSGTGDWGVLSDAKSKLAQAVAQARSLTIDTICLWFNYTFHRHDQGKHLGKYFVQRPRTGCWTHVVVNGVAMELPPGTFVKGEFNVDLMRQPGRAYTQLQHGTPAALPLLAHAMMGAMPEQSQGEMSRSHVTGCQHRDIAVGAAHAGLTPCSAVRCGAGCVRHLPSDVPVRACAWHLQGASWCCPCWRRCSRP